MSKIVGHINVPKIKPALEDLVVTPSLEDQNFKSIKDGYDNVCVKAVHGDDLTVTPTLKEQNITGLYENIKVEGIVGDTLNVTPSTETQTNEGVYTKVIVEGASALKPENIRKDETIFGVTGTMVSINGENAGIDTSTAYTKDQLEKIVTMLPDLNLTSYTTGNSLFSNWPKLERVGKLNTSRLVDTLSMFYGCQKLKSVDKLNTSNVTNMSNMFTNCYSLTDLAQFDTSNVTIFNGMFNGCTALKTVPLFNTSKATQMGTMFYGCTALTSIPQFDTSKVTTMNSMFRGCSELTDVPELDASSICIVSGSLGTSSVFEECYKLTNFGGFKDLGKGFTNVEYGYYVVDFTFLTMLTYDSLLNLLNKLYDLNLTYNVANGGTLVRQIITLGVNNKSKLQATEEGLQAIATANAKGWDIR